mmetsp:Transcript_99215/g.319966  ORF Transcript_99215/g.319966 Transcript_99215/m.319966 type:complete len:205 (-) Transcript_99215:287-901(-)
MVLQKVLHPGPVIRLLLKHLLQQQYCLWGRVGARGQNLNLLLFHPVLELLPDFGGVHDLHQRCRPVQKRDLAPAQKLEEHHPQRPHICLGVHLVKVAWLETPLQDHRDARPSLRRLVARVTPREVGVDGKCGTPKVADCHPRHALRRFWIKLLHDEDVVGLEVIVDHALVMHECHTQHHLLKDLSNPYFLDLCQGMSHLLHVME